MVEHKKHRNILYTLVIIVAILQVVSFTVLIIQMSRLESRLTSEVQGAKEESKEFTTSLVERYNSQYQENFNEISQVLVQQKESLEQQIKVIKSSQQDFSSIVEDAVKGVVTVSTEKSIGSGFIVDSSGYIITNYHVIAGQEDTITVLTYARKLVPAEYLGKDEERDMALIKIPGEYEYLKLADSDTLQVGKKVIAIGNPLGLSFTVTEGIISALNRRGPNGLPEYIQTDVSLNPGNSGGPLIDTSGSAVGINNFKIGGAESLGFSLESNAIRDSITKITNSSLSLE
ncbi:MAG: trypsin-like peptidase domain-containing protein [Nanoarchaeota archaeon]